MAKDLICGRVSRKPKATFSRNALFQMFSLACSVFNVLQSLLTRRNPELFAAFRYAIK